MFKELNILKLFFERPTKEFNVREVARLLRVSPATASKELKKMASYDVLKERKERLFRFYKANLENDYYKDLKVFYNLRKIKESGLIKDLNRFYLKPTIILFGSSVSGLDTETSDFDLVILSEKKKEFPDADKFEKKLKRKLQIFVVRNIRDLSNKHLINNVLNGIVLQGEIKWI